MTKKNGLSEAARKAKNEYARRWRRKNPDKAKAIHDRYWERKAMMLEVEEKKRGDRGA